MSGDVKEMLNQFNIERGRNPLLGLEKLSVMPEDVRELLNQFDIERGRTPLLGLEKLYICHNFDTNAGGCQRNVEQILH
jgi:hypothetical protein